MFSRDDLFGERKPRRSPARFIVPLLLIAVIAGTYLIVHHGLKVINQSSSSATVVARPKRKLTRTQRKYAHAHFYVVQPGDSLTLISSKTGVNLPTLEVLNPKLNPNSLQLGQRIRLRR